jgi:acetyl esterase
MTTTTRPTPQPAVTAVTGAAPTPAPLPHTTTITRRTTTDRVRPVDLTARVDVHDLTIPGGPDGQTWLRIFQPAGTTTALPAVLYIHGDTSVFGNARTRRLASKLATDLPGAVIVVDYSLSPKARCPIAIEETYTAATWIAEHGSTHGLDPTRIALATDPTGADLADELMLLADQRHGPTLAGHVLLSSRTTAALRAALAA